MPLTKEKGSGQWLRATAVACAAFIAGGLAASCDALLHEGTEVRGGECAACHLADYQDARAPVHVDALPLGCADCHDQDAWSPAHAFEHSKKFPLRGKHTYVACKACHTQGFNPGDTPHACVGCHRGDYDAARMPTHDSFSTRCESCHKESGWKPASFDHPWPLTGAHAGTLCTSCHVGDPPVYGGTSKACVSCHRDDYDGSPYPGHSAFATTCQDCHSTADWTPAIFEHPWPLTGAHARTMCASCHAGDPPVYEGTSKACVSCHRADYDGSPYPGHSSFSTRCQDCHSTTGWKPASGGVHPEARFPIRNGPHSRFDCASCHNEALGPIGRDNSDCVGCHTGEHTRARMDEKHHEVEEYPTGAAAPNFCLDCHPDGRK